MVFALVAILVFVAVIIAFAYAYRQRKAARPFGPISQDDQPRDSMNMPFNEIPLITLR